VRVCGPEQVVRVPAARGLLRVRLRVFDQTCARGQLSLLKHCLANHFHHLLISCSAGKKDRRPSGESTSWTAKIATRHDLTRTREKNNPPISRCEVGLNRGEPKPATG
jgi:hypothetical protein